MAHSSLWSIDRAAATPAGRDAGALGPSDSSDSGSDIGGADTPAEGDPGLPVDVATAPDSVRPVRPQESIAESDTDAAGTGERRSAGGDAGRREAADIGPDRVVDDLDADGDDGEALPPDLAALYAADDEGDDEDELGIDDDDGTEEGAMAPVEREKRRGAGRR